MTLHQVIGYQFLPSPLGLQQAKPLRYACDSLRQVRLRGPHAPYDVSVCMSADLYSNGSMCNRSSTRIGMCYTEKAPNAWQRRGTKKNVLVCTAKVRRLYTIALQKPPCRCRAFDAIDGDVTRIIQVRLKAEHSKHAQQDRSVGGTCNLKAATDHAECSVVVPVAGPRPCPYSDRRVGHDSLREWHICSKLFRKAAV